MRGLAGWAAGGETPRGGRYYGSQSAHSFFAQQLRALQKIPLPGLHFPLPSWTDLWREDRQDQVRAVGRQNYRRRVVRVQLAAEGGIAAVRRPLDHSRLRERFEERRDRGVGVDEAPGGISMLPWRTHVLRARAAPHDVDYFWLRQRWRRRELLLARRVRASFQLLKEREYLSGHH